MKIRGFITYASTVAALGGGLFLAQRVQAGPMLGQVSIHLGHEQQQPQPPPPPPQYQQQQPRYQPNWNDDQKRELRHIYYRLEHATEGYGGHRENALREIRNAAEIMGMDLRGSGYAQQWQGSPNYGGYGQYGQQPQSEEFSEDAIHRAHDRLIDLARNTGDPVRRHLVDAARELDMALLAR
jgi:hypothetical protein